MPVRVLETDFAPVLMVDADADAAWLQRRLQDEGIVVHGTSELGMAIRDTIEFAKAVRGEAPHWDHDRERGRLRRVGEWSPLFRSLSRARFDSSLVNRDHLKLLTKSGSGKAVDRRWELRIGLAAGAFAPFVKLHGEHENPDVSFYSSSMQILSQPGRWGVECLVLHTTRDSKWLATVAAKADQLEGLDVNRGFIALNLSRVIDTTVFESALEDRLGRRTRGELQEVMERELEIVATRIDRAPFWNKIVRQQIAGVLFHADVVTAFDGRLASLGIGRIVMRTADRPAIEAAHRLLRALGT